MPDEVVRSGHLTQVSVEVRAAIRRQNLTAYTLSKRARVSVDPIQRFVNGERGLNLATLDKVCVALGLVLVDAHGPGPVTSNPLAESDLEPRILPQDGPDGAEANSPRPTPFSAFFTVATQTQANIDDTARLLFNHSAVWMPPMSIPPCGVVPQPGDSFWLLYLDGQQTRVLAGGPLAQSPRVMGPAGYRVLWNNADRPGLRDDARSLGYGGPHNMTFFRLDPPRLFGLDFAQAATLPGAWNPGLNLATAGQEAALRGVLPV